MEKFVGNDASRSSLALLYRLASSSVETKPWTFLYAKCVYKAHVPLEAGVMLFKDRRLGKRRT